MSGKSDKREAKKAENGSKMALIAIIIGMIILAIVATIALNARTMGGKLDPVTGEPRGVIDCMPPLTEDEAELCEEAERKGWPVVY